MSKKMGAMASWIRAEADGETKDGKTRVPRWNDEHSKQNEDKER